MSKEVTHPEGELMASKEQAKRQWKLDAISTGTGVFLAIFMWGHMFFVSSFLSGERGFNWISIGFTLICYHIVGLPGGSGIRINGNPNRKYPKWT